MYAPNPHAERKAVMSVEDIRSIVGPIAERFGVDAVYLFGSVVRGDYTEDSDYDFSINEGKLSGYYEMLDFIDALAYALGRDVEVVTRSDLGDKSFIDNMTKDEVLIYAV